MRIVRSLVTLVAFAATVCAQDAAGRAYEALKSNDYAAALQAFSEAVAAQPERASLRKDFAYALLRAGEREKARDQFAEALRLDPKDDRTALEYAFLCYETHLQVEARRVFNRLRSHGALEETRTTAAAAFENIDRPLREGIETWKRNVSAAPGQWSAHEELARLAEQRDELDLAAGHYREAWRLRPENRKLLLDLGRVNREQGKERESTAAFLAAARSTEPRVAESAREFLAARYPYVYEFEDALDLDPANTLLRREYAYLLLAMDRTPEALRQFRLVLAGNPDDATARRQLELLASPPAGAPTKAVPSALEMGRRSLERSYLNDAVRYFQIAHEEDSSNAEVMLGLARAYNQMGRDDEALRWLNRARRSGDSSAAREAARDYRNLRETSASFRITTWTLPLYSSRWSQGLFYGQVKGEWKLKKLPIRPYLSTRIIADTQGDASGTRVNPLFPAYLSETAVIAGVGVAAPLKYGFYLWGEAGEAFSYLGRRLDSGIAQPDYRGGVAWMRGFGQGAGTVRSGWFAETGLDSVYVSRFAGNILTYAQNRTGYTFAGNDAAWHLQALWNWNVTVGLKREYWANFVETGPGLRFRWRGLPPPMMFRVDLLKGAYLYNQFNPLGPQFWDVRAGVWYAFTH